MDKQLKDKLGLFYDRISRRLPKERESDKVKPAEKAEEQEDDEERTSLLQKIRPQRVSARRAQVMFVVNRFTGICALLRLC